MKTDSKLFIILFHSIFFSFQLRKIFIFITYSQIELFALFSIQHKLIAFILFGLKLALSRIYMRI